MTARVDNYAGFPVGMSGSGLVERMFRQSERFGIEAGDHTADNIYSS